MKAYLIREYHSDRTEGVLLLLNNNGDVVTWCRTLEEAWKDNERKVSCIPEGQYKVVKRQSAKFGTHFHLQEVQDRSLILIHAGNDLGDTEGCILVGVSMKKGSLVQSRVALYNFLEKAPKGFTLRVEKGVENT